MNAPRKIHKVLILCTGNSARSIIGEYILRQKGKGRFDVHSAGAKPSGKVHPLALSVLKQYYGIDASEARSKSWDEFKNVQFDFVITVCDNARESCPIWPGQPIVAHWGSPDPAAFKGSDGEKRQFFIQVATQMARRIDLFCALPVEKLQALAVRHIGEQFKMKDENAMAH